MSEIREVVPAVGTRGGSTGGALFPGYRIAAIVPCHNEAAAIGKVVRDLHAHVPGIDVYVYDNNSTDGTAEVARTAGAMVRHESRKGKGNVVRRAFADVEADIYLLIDGDDTYDAAAAPAMIDALLAGPYDHVLGVRQPEEGLAEVYRPGHEAGNRLLNAVVGRVFGEDVGDMLSGYRVLSRRFVKTFVAESQAFEIETELTVHCLTTRVPATTVPVGFRDRAEGTESKLNTFSDGFKILGTIAALARHERPALVHSALAGLVLLLGLPLALIAGWEPVALADITVAAVVLGVGLVLGGLRRTHRQLSRMSFLMQPGLRLRPELVVDDVVAERANGRAGEEALESSGDALPQPVRIRSRMEHVV